MDLKCPCCGFATRVPDDALPPDGARARCSSCGGASVFLKGGLVLDDPTPPQPMDVPHAAPSRATASAAPSLAASAAPSLAASAAPSLAASAAPSRAAGTEGSWRIKGARGEEGPFDHATVKSLIRSGDLVEDDLALPPGAMTWSRAGDVQSLRRYFALRARHLKEGSDQPATRCRNHAAVRATWLCQSCGNTWCDACVKEHRTTPVRILRICATCSGACQALEAPKVIVPFWKDVPRVLTYPIRRGGWLALILCALVSSAASVAAHAGLYGWFGAAFLTLSVYAYLLLIVRRTSEGVDHVPDLGFVENPYSDLVFPGLKAVIVSLVVFIPMGYWVVKVVVPAAASAAAGELQAEAEPEDEMADDDDTIGYADDEASDTDEDDGTDDGGSAALTDDQREVDERLDALMHRNGRPSPGRPPEPSPRSGGGGGPGLVIAVLGLIALCIYGVAALPILLIIVALFNTVAPAFNPPLIWRLVNEIRKEYAICVAFVAALSVASLLAALPFAGIPILGGFLSNIASGYFTFAAFHVMGRTAELAQQKIDWY